jgi:hypothetical protein
MPPSDRRARSQDRSLLENAGSSAAAATRAWRLTPLGKQVTDAERSIRQRAREHEK